MVYPRYLKVSEQIYPVQATWHLRPIPRQHINVKVVIFVILPFKPTSHA
jgi:hypothetical protein